MQAVARKLRIQFPGAIYHVMSRGDHRQNIVRDDQDRNRFIETLAQACAKTGWQVHAFCLMPNHFHIVVETPQPNLVTGMTWLLGTYTTRFNRRHRDIGHLFSGRYKSLLVGGEGGYLRTVCEYVHLNPARASLVPPDRPLSGYLWSSYPFYLMPSSRRPEWLRVDRLLGEYRIAKDSPTGRRVLEEAIESRRNAETDADFAPIQKGWFLGDDNFRRELLEQMEGQTGPHHYGQSVRETAEAKSERWVVKELIARGWKEADLAQRRKGDPEKAAMAIALRRETTATLAWIADRLRMGTREHLSHLIYWSQRNSQTQT